MTITLPTVDVTQLESPAAVAQAMLNVAYEALDACGTAETLNRVEVVAGAVVWDLSLIHI